MEETEDTPAPPRLPPPPPPPVAAFDEGVVEAAPAPQLANDRDHPPHNPHDIHPEWLNLVMAFCFTSISISLQCQDSSCLSTTFHSACISLVSALAAFVISKYIHANQRTLAQMLEYAGVFGGVTAFFLAITPTFPLFFKVITWTIYVVSIIAIVLSHLGFF